MLFRRRYRYTFGLSFEFINGQRRVIVMDDDFLMLIGEIQKKMYDDYDTSVCFAVGCNLKRTSVTFFLMIFVAVLIFFVKLD